MCGWSSLGPGSVCVDDGAVVVDGVCEGVVVDRDVELEFEGVGLEDCFGAWGGPVERPPRGGSGVDVVVVVEVGDGGVCEAVEAEGDAVLVAAAVAVCEVVVVVGLETAVFEVAGEAAVAVGADPFAGGFAPLVGEERDLVDDLAFGVGFEEAGWGAECHRVLVGATGETEFAVRVVEDDVVVAERAGARCVDGPPRPVGVEDA